MNTNKFVVGLYFPENPPIELGYDPESAVNKLLEFVYNNTDMFGAQLNKINDSCYRVTVLDNALLKAKEQFVDNEEVLDIINKCQENWPTACVYCKSVTLNYTPYTYRDYAGTVGREYNCPHCSDLSNESAHLVSKAYKRGGHFEALKAINGLLYG